MTSGSHRFPTYHIPDDGTRYAPGEVMMSCRPATEYGDGPPLLRVDLHKREAPPTEDPEPWAPWRS